jgi:hypothetical protein
VIAGGIWALFGLLKARSLRFFKVETGNIFLNVIPRFDQELLACKLNCIFSLKISHIIFTAGKFILIILKNRRIRNYG